MDDFYRIIEQNEIPDTTPNVQEGPGQKFTFMVWLNPDHPVYSGHFPGNPVVPGVCQVHLIKELSSLVLKKEVVLSFSDNIKFLSMIRPRDTSLLKVSMDIREKEAGRWNVTASISGNDQLFLKFKGIIIPEIEQS